MSIDAIPDFAALPRPVALVAHDAGAANIIIGWFKSSPPSADMRVHLAGPALVAWQAAFPHHPAMALDKALEGAGSLLSGTSWQSAVEHEARSAARASGVPTIAVIDHWVNYRQRFVRDDTEVLPDRIWVADRYALDIATAEFPGIPVEQYANRYLDAEVEAVAAIDEVRPALPPGDRVLYALEPIRLEWQGSDPRPGEFQALDYFLSRLADLGISEHADIRLRPHPSDPPGKYDDWISDQGRPGITIAPDEPIAQAVAWSNWVAGCESFVLIIGTAAGRRTVSTLPPWGNAFRLPQQSIIRLRELPGANEIVQPK